MRLDYLLMRIDAIPLSAFLLGIIFLVQPTGWDRSSLRLFRQISAARARILIEKRLFDKFLQLFET